MSILTIFVIDPVSFLLIFCSGNQEERVKWNSKNEIKLASFFLCVSGANSYRRQRISEFYRRQIKLSAAKVYLPPIILFAADNFVIFLICMGFPYKLIFSLLLFLEEKNKIKQNRRQKGSIRKGEGETRGEKEWVENYMHFSYK